MLSNVWKQNFTSLAAILKMAAYRCQFGAGDIHFLCWDKSKWQNNIGFICSCQVNVGYIASIGPID